MKEHLLRDSGTLAEKGKIKTNFGSILVPGEYRKCPRAKMSYPKRRPLLPYIEDFFPRNYKIISYEGVSINFKYEVVTRFLSLLEYDISEDITCKSEKSFLKSFYNAIKENSKENGKLEYLKHRTLLACEYSIPHSIVFAPHDFSPSLEGEKADLYYRIYVLTYDNTCKPLGRSYSFEEFRCFLKNLRGGESFSHVKTLNIARTLLECYLATTDTPWPGDVDGILVEEQDKCLIPKALLEFKTHNLSSPVCNESISKYITKDKRRIQALFIIQKFLKLPLFYIIWQPRKEEIKIQKIVPEVNINIQIQNGEIIEGWEEVSQYILQNLDL